MKSFFTWHDVETVFEKERYTWPESWNDVKVYSDSVMIYYKPDRMAEEESRQYLKKIFRRNYNVTENTILIDFSQIYLDVIGEEDEEECRKMRPYAPLFKEIYFSPDRMNEAENALPGARMIAFHSYKGGVGRTLSLISLLRECTAQYPDKKVLVIDADIEAPGLTWMLKEQGNDSISYLDMLSVMNYDKITENVIDKLAELIKMSTMSVATDKMEKEHYFIPVYLEKEQVMDIFTSPERILLTQDNKFYITDTISKIGKALKADLVLVDLRAGITEYSAPFLFDPRVEKFYVTSTSLQSVKGINQILERIYRTEESNFLNSKILVTMIPGTMKEDQVREVEDRILNNLEHAFDTAASTFLRENYIVEFEFDEGLVHLDDFSSTCTALQGRGITKVMKGVAEGLFVPLGDTVLEFQESETREILKKLYSIAANEVAAEGNAGTNMLVTSSIKEIARNFKTILPKIVISGAKGSGKTYIYKQLLSAKTWGGFEKSIDGTSGDDGVNTIFVPLVATLNSPKFKMLIEGCIDQMNLELGDIKVKSNYINENLLNLGRYLEQNEMLTKSQWVEKWTEAVLLPFGGTFQELSELDEFLEKKHKRIILIVDGLEDLCMDAQRAKLDSWKVAIKAICQYIINKLNDLDYGNIGIMVFARKDMLNEAIETNYEQFRTIYLKYELNWSQTEALRLALWLSARAYPALAEGVDILIATKEVLVDKLTRLWGHKLGKPNSKEAFSNLWIMAALSDFTGQLQARDIVRFLKYATQNYSDMKLIYHDRLIMPTDIRNAIVSCSNDKLTEIKAEMKHIYEILEMFMNMDADKKSLPMLLNQMDLTAEQISRLEIQGFLKISDQKYYLPEIIRLSLGFKYVKGARPKVLSLLVQ